MMGTLNCLRCRFRHEDNGNCTAVGGFCTAVPAAHCPLLREYLDTGLESEEIERSKLEIEAGCVKAIARTYGIDINRLRKLAEADKDGRLVVLPFSDADDVEMQRDGITYKSDHWNILLTAFADNYLTLSGRKIGIFSVEEAEKALEAMKNA